MRSVDELTSAGDPHALGAIRRARIEATANNAAVSTAFLSVTAFLASLIYEVGRPTYALVALLLAVGLWIATRSALRLVARGTLAWSYGAIFSLNAAAHIVGLTVWNAFLDPRINGYVNITQAPLAMLTYNEMRIGVATTLGVYSVWFIAALVAQPLRGIPLGADDWFFVAFMLPVGFCLIIAHGAKLRQRQKLATAQRELEDAKATAEGQAEQLREVDRRKTYFFQNVSHELRTPLTLLLAPLDRWASREPDSAEAQMARRNALRLLRLVNQLLDLQKLQAQRATLRAEPVALGQFLGRSAEYVRSAAEARAITFTTALDGDPVIAADVDALEKIVFNLLSNALKYTPRGGRIELGCRVDGECVRVHVRDTGPGISEAGQRLLFQAFSQVDETTTREFEGTGLGLALVKHLAEAMQATVGVESRPGAGSTFWVELPLAAGTGAAPAAPSTRAPDWLLADVAAAPALAADPVGGDGARVLIVDDLPDMRHLLASVLAAHGYRVSTASDGADGLARARDEAPDLIVSDWMMPRMSGPELIRALRRDDALRAVPVVLLTAKADEESRLEGLDVGADAFVGKPFTEREILSVTRNLVELKRRERELAALNRYITEGVLKRYLPEDVVADILSGQLALGGAAAQRPITVLFADLCGFTALAERLAPAALADLLNDYLTAMSHVVLEQGGTIDKFIGDAIMVFFGAPRDMPLAEQAERATRCGVAMQAAMGAVATRWQGALDRPLQMRVGIHQGLAVVGNVGSDRRVEYTAIGATVNLASRIEAACEPGAVYVSEQVAAHVRDAVELVGARPLKGIEGERTLYRVPVPAASAARGALPVSA